METKPLFLALASWCTISLFLNGALADDSQNGIADHDYDTWEAPYQMQKDFPYYISGFDEEGRPIFIGEVGRWPIRKYVEEGPETIKTLDKYITQALWRYNQSIGIKNTADNPVTDGIVLLDMDEFNNIQLTSLPTLDLLLKKAREVEIVARRMDKGFFVNVNFIGESLINVLRPILGPSLARTDIYGTNKANWIPKLLRKLPKDQIPEWYGGSKKTHAIQSLGLNGVEAYEISENIILVFIGDSTVYKINLFIDLCFTKM